jgi:hypothetical protein
MIDIVITSRGSRGCSYIDFIISKERDEYCCKAVPPSQPINTRKEDHSWSLRIICNHLPQPYTSSCGCCLLSWWVCCGIDFILILADDQMNV